MSLPRFVGDSDNTRPLLANTLSSCPSSSSRRRSEGLGSLNKLPCWQTTVRAASAEFTRPGRTTSYLGPAMRANVYRWVITLLFACTAFATGATSAQGQEPQHANDQRQGPTTDRKDPDELKEVRKKARERELKELLEAIEKAQANPPGEEMRQRLVEKDREQQAEKLTRPLKRIAVLVIGAICLAAIGELLSWACRLLRGSPSSPARRSRKLSRREQQALLDAQGKRYRRLKTLGVALLVIAVIGTLGCWIADAAGAPIVVTALGAAVFVAGVAGLLCLLAPLPRGGTMPDLPFSPADELFKR